jgi:hypothetical protein
VRRPADGARRTPAQALAATLIALEHAAGLHARAQANARAALAQDQARVRVHEAVAAQLGAVTVPSPRVPAEQAAGLTV